MHFNSRYSLRAQLMLPLVVVSLVSLIATAGIGAWWATIDTRQRIETQLAGVVNVLADSRFPLTTPVLEQMSDLAGSEFVVTDDTGAVIASSGPQLPDGFADRQPTRNDRLITLGPRVEISTTSYYHSSLKVSKPTSSSSPSTLHVLYPSSAYDAAWRRAFLLPIVVGVGTLLAVVFVAILFARRVSYVTQQLASDVQSLASENRADVSLPSRDDELRDLAIAMQATVKQLDQYESQIRDTERLQTANLLGAALAHEMRNAATGARVAIDLCEQSHEAKSEALVMARRQLSVMESRLRRFLQLAGGANESNKTTTESRQVQSIQPAIQEAVELVEYKARHAGINVTATLGNENHESLIDRDGMVQAVLNLLINAIDATLQIDKAKVKVVVRSEDEVVIVGVEDNGPGVDPSIQQSLFKPFITTKPEGAGLGLASVQRFANSHGGRIQYERIDGITSFQLFLPKSQGA